MTLVLRRQPLNFPHDDPDARWSVYRDDIGVGVIVESRGRSDEPNRWDWVIHLHAGRHQNGMNHTKATSGSEETREAAMLAFRAAFDHCLIFIGTEGWARHLEHDAWSQAQSKRWARQRAGTEPGGYG